MARYQIIIAYDGTCFAGSQRQAKLRTVQSVLEEALRRIGWQGHSVLLSGRTDTGVHAAGQVAAVDLEWSHSPDDLLRALNAHLPSDMAARAVRVAPERFHPRFDALARRYVYRLYCQPVRDPLRDRTQWRVWPVVDGAWLADAARELLGTHDFSAFGSPPRAGGSTMRTVTQSCWQQAGDTWTFEVQANAFLYRMVRRMVYVQVAVGLGRIPVGAIRLALNGQGALPAGLAPACGLTLTEVVYPDDESVSKEIIKSVSGEDDV